MPIWLSKLLLRVFGPLLNKLFEGGVQGDDAPGALNGPDDEDR